MTALPALAALATGGVLVANGRGRVLHVAVPDRRGLTPTGRLRRGSAPVCGQHARRWSRAEVDGRRLCRRCAKRTPDGLPLTVDRSALIRGLVDTLHTAPDVATVDAAAAAMCTPSARLMAALVDGPHGHPVRLTQLVARARDRIAAVPQPHVPLRVVRGGS